MNSKPEQQQISLLKWMLEDIRKVTLSGVEHLTNQQLFTPPIEREYPIGAYLMHLAEADIGWLQVISGKQVDEEIKKRAYYSKWYDCGPDYDPPKEPIEIMEYFDVMKITRDMFMSHISTIKDDEMEDVIKWEYEGNKRERSKKWIIYHILEHEAHTRGQMFLLIRKAGWNKKPD